MTATVPIFTGVPVNDAVSEVRARNSTLESLGVSASHVRYPHCGRCPAPQAAA